MYMFVDLSMFFYLIFFIYYCTHDIFIAFVQRAVIRTVYDDFESLPLFDRYHEGFISTRKC